MTSSLSSKPSVQSTPEATALNVPVPEVDRQNKVDLKNNWPELNFQPVAVAPSVRPARKFVPSDGLALQGAKTAIEAKQPSLINQVTKVTEASINASSDETVQLDESISSLDGSIEFSVVQRSKATSGSAPVKPTRSLKHFGLAAAVAIAMPMGVYGYGAIYPSLQCQGKAQELIKRSFQTTCNFYIPNELFVSLDRPDGVNLYEGKFPDNVQPEEIVAMHLAASVSDIVLLLGFDLQEQEKNPDKLIEHHAHVYRTMVKHVIEGNPEVQWVLVDHPGDIMKMLVNLPNLSQDTMSTALSLLDT
jgi:hypothetical protein